MQAPPAALEFLELGVVHDGRELLRDFGVDLLYCFVDREVEVFRIGDRPLEGLLGQRPEELLGAFRLCLFGSADRPLEQIGSALGYCFGLWRGLELSSLCHSYVSFSLTGAPLPSLAEEA